MMNLFHIFCFIQWILHSYSLTKVLIPAVYKEWEHGKPEWATNSEIQQKHNFSIFLYQKVNPDQPNYFEYNRGAECGTYLKYIVDHYDNFPDVAMFVHAKPEHHQKKLNWLNMLHCISPNATYMNINDQSWVTRSPKSWRRIEQWTEQCWRDILQITWELKDDKNEFLKRLPPNQDIIMSAQCCNQFIISRDMIRKRPLHVWKDLLRIIGVDNACHLGEPDYENLYFFNKTGRAKLGAEPKDVA
mmetsp:Transcript_15124/g.25220  ORF Transcript_15124/g.25220 Transcript_15124/m.25220 type:complete len:244 (+) Transcript_15124:33-764(+)